MKEIEILKDNITLDDKLDIVRRRLSRSFILFLRYLEIPADMLSLTNVKSHASSHYLFKSIWFGRDDKVRSRGSQNLQDTIPNRFSRLDIWESPSEILLRDGRKIFWSVNNGYPRISKELLHPTQSMVFVKNLPITMP